jgi:S-DNA-T family DNA segregation ATPase FtsK/SpoIIIE
VIRLDDPGVSRAHARLVVDDGGVHLHDLDATNPSKVDGYDLPDQAAVSPGSRVRMGSTTFVVRRIETRPAAVHDHEGVVRINRPPRFVGPSNPATIRFPAAPERPTGARAPVIAALSPLVIAVALALVMRSPAILLFALMSPVMLFAQWWGDRRHGRRSFRAQQAEFRLAVEKEEARLAEALSGETRERHLEQPDLAFAGRVALARDARLWERRPGDADHLVVRVGTADQPARTIVHRPDQSLPPPRVRDIPVVVDLAEATVFGIAGPRKRSLAVAGAMLAQLAIWHSPRTTRVVVLSVATNAEADWAWAARLPHALGEPHGPLAMVASVEDEASLASRIEELGALVRVREEDSSAGREPTAPLPHVIVVLDGAQQLRARPGVAALLRAPGDTGIHVIALDELPERLPAESRGQLTLDWEPAARATLQLADRTIDDVTPDLPHRSWLEATSRALAPLEDATPDPGAGPLPASLGLREAHLADGLDPTSADDLVAAWAAWDGHPTALLGVAAEGPFRVDLAQDGPHCLVGGTTGSGKSELLQGLVTGLAVAAPPDELTFVLVDYKGGSAFKECAALPHTLGLVTDLDEHLTSRALVSLGAELKRREGLLASAGAKDLDDYRRLRSLSRELTRIARLVIVVDEFKMLADELPDFVDGLVRVAAVGRSLGVHLVLATQRPGGIVTGDMRANVSLRIGLRVRDRSDSEDVIESPAAAQISDRSPGRAMVRTAGGRLVELQAAYPGAAFSAAGSRHPQPPRVHPLTWTDLGRPAPQAVRPDEGDSTELEAAVDAAREAAERLGISAPQSPWLPALPTSVSVESLVRAAGTGSAPLGDVAEGSGAAPLGLSDEPERQSRSTYTWHPVTDGHLAIAGGARTGRSTTLRTLALGLAERWDPSRLHLHLLEGTAGSLSDLAALPHVGSVTSTTDPRLAARAIARLADGLKRSSPPHSGSSPAVVVLVDGWEALEDAFDTIDHGAPTETLLRMGRDGLSAGLRLVITGGRSLVSGRLASIVQRRLVLPVPDALDLTLAGLAPDEFKGHHGAGRAIDVGSRHHVQIAHVGEAPGAREQAQAVERLAARLNADLPTDRSCLPWRLLPLPGVTSWSALPPASRDRLWLGLGGDDAAPVGVDEGHSQRRVTILGPQRSGRTTALALVARQLTALGRPVALVATRRTSPTWLAGIQGLHLVPSTEGDQLRELRVRHPDLCVLVDDAEALDGSPAESFVLEAFHDLDRTSAWCVAAVDSRRATSLYRGLVPELTRHGTGVVLWPTSPTDGELLGARVEVTQHRVPGRGVLVVDGLATPLQLADATPTGDRLPTVPRASQVRSDPLDTGCSPDGHPVPTGVLPRGS